MELGTNKRDIHEHAKIKSFHPNKRRASIRTVARRIGG
jgi:hypothetical protein